MKEINYGKVIKVTNNRYRLKYHVSAPSGWMNDPNGFAFFKGYYHIFYQYYPYGSSWGPMHWGHYRSKDLIHWENLPVALIPGDQEDSDGCFSGSAIVKDNRLYLIYTGHHYYDIHDSDHFWQNQNVAYSDDGIHFEKYENNPVIALPPTDNTQHFRDPKVWRHEENYYVILGSQNTKNLGRVLLYTSKNLLNWDYLGPLTQSKSTDTEGYMWECPDFFGLEDKSILLCSPQGIKSTNKQFLNLYQTGYFVGKMDYKNHNFSRGDFKELDKGHDFYATQTLDAPDGRRIMFGWMDMWEADMPEKQDGWAGALTLPRELTLKKDRLLMNPIKECVKLRQKKIIDDKILIRNNNLNISDAQHIEINLKAILVNWPGNNFKISLLDSCNDSEIVSLALNKINKKLVLFRRGKDSLRFGNVASNQALSLRIFIDTSSVEFFVNKGETVFTERFYTNDKLKISVAADKDLDANVKVYAL